MPMTRPNRIALIAVIGVVTCGLLSRAQLLPEKTRQTGSKARTKPAHTEAKRPVQEPEVVRIPAGEFRMGSGVGREDERPLHRVYVSEFSISKYPVSNAEYKRFVDATGHRPPAGKEKGIPLWNGRDFPAEIAGQPVVKVSWDDAAAYCVWLSNQTGKPYRLPTEAEWEKAARGGLEQKEYPWGDEAPDESKAWFGRQWNGLETLKNVGYGFGNGYGLYGMAGNVRQWVADLYNAHYYAHSSPRDPQGPFGGLDRVVRSASAFDAASHLRCASRSFTLPTDRDAGIGFRVARRP
jgi:formylglycine-generating enzyme required for sulfatase activity